MLFFFSKSNALRHLSVLFLLTCHSNILLGARLLSEDSINDENDYEINDIESRVEGRSEGEIAYTFAFFLLLKEGVYCNRADSKLNENTDIDLEYCADLCASEIGCTFFVFGYDDNWFLGTRALCYWTKVRTENNFPICEEGYEDGGWDEDENFNLFVLNRK